VNFNVPDGSYSSDPARGEVRIRELKEMVRRLHSLGLSVVMDVVYNHVYEADNFCFNKIVPGYFSRQKSRGGLQNDSGCGNDTATERSMVRKFIVDSVKYWADEYHIDGFRFDLVGLIDVPTVRDIVATVRKNHPNVIFYGEGWDMCTAHSTARTPMMIQKNAKLVPRFGFFNDKIRDCIRGSVFKEEEIGFISGKKRDYWDLAFCYAGLPGWTDRPAQSINYVSCHDNHTLFDKICASTPKATTAERIRMNRLAAAFVLTARGVPFFLGGEEMLRTKPDGNGGYDHNSYRSSDAVNAMRWDTLEQEVYRKTAEYYRGLIAFRKANPQLRTGLADEVIPIDTCDDHCVAYTVRENTLAIFNAGKEPFSFPLPIGTWQIFIDGEEAGTNVLMTVKETVEVAPISALILRRKEA
jgi:pullulanase